MHENVCAEALVGEAKRPSQERFIEEFDSDTQAASRGVVCTGCLVTIEVQDVAKVFLTHLTTCLDSCTETTHLM